MKVFKILLVILLFSCSKQEEVRYDYAASINKDYKKEWYRDNLYGIYTWDGLRSDTKELIPLNYPYSEPHRLKADLSSFLDNQTKVVITDTPDSLKIGVYNTKLKFFFVDYGMNEYCTEYFWFEIK